MAHSSPFVSRPEFQEPLGYLGELPDDWQPRALDKMGELLGKYRSLRVYLDSCVTSFSDPPFGSAASWLDA